MSKLPSKTGKSLIKLLKKAGFEEIRIKGSHHFLRHADGISTVVPVHSIFTGVKYSDGIAKTCFFTANERYFL